MIWIYLKLLVATVLIAIPLIIRYFLCSKNNQKTKIDSLPNIMKKNIPRWRKWFLKLLVMGNNYLRRMSVSIKHRHLFRLILIMVMLIVMCSALFSPNGGGFLFTELLYVFLIASWIYPAFDKQKSHRFYSLKQIKSKRCKG